MKSSNLAINSNTFVFFKTFDMNTVKQCIVPIVPYRELHKSTNDFGSKKRNEPIVIKQNTNKNIIVAFFQLKCDWPFGSIPNSAKYFFNSKKIAIVTQSRLLNRSKWKCAGIFQIAFWNLLSKNEFDNFFQLDKLLSWKMNMVWCPLNLVVLSKYTNFLITIE